MLGRLGVNAPAPTASDDDAAAAAALDAVTAELGADWPKQVEPRFDAAKAILFDDRWASAREDLARAYHAGDPTALAGGFVGLGDAVAAEARWFASRLESAGTARDVDGAAGSTGAARDAADLRFGRRIAADVHGPTAAIVSAHDGSPADVVAIVERARRGEAKPVAVFAAH